MNRSFAAAGAALALGACSLPAADKQSDAAARQLFEEVRTGGNLDADPNLSPALKTDDAEAAFAQVRAMLPPGAPVSVQNAGWNYASSSGAGASAQLAYAYKYATAVFHVQTVLQKAPGQANWTITGFEIEPDGATSGPTIIGERPKSAADTQ
jgi:hypothetical protein